MLRNMDSPKRTKLRSYPRKVPFVDIAAAVEGVAWKLDSTEASKCTPVVCTVKQYYYISLTPLFLVSLIIINRGNKL